MSFSNNEVFVDAITIECSECKHVETYEAETDMYQGEMWGLDDGRNICNNCLQKGLDN
jgi:hypothetical protein